MFMITSFHWFCTTTEFDVFEYFIIHKDSILNFCLNKLYILILGQDNMINHRLNASIYFECVPQLECELYDIATHSAHRCDSDLRRVSSCSAAFITHVLMCPKSI